MTREASVKRGSPQTLMKFWQRDAEEGRNQEPRGARGGAAALESPRGGARPPREKSPGGSCRRAPPPRGGATAAPPSAARPHAAAGAPRSLTNTVRPGDTGEKALPATRVPASSPVSGPWRRDVQMHSGVTPGQLLKPPPGADLLTAWIPRRERALSPRFSRGLLSDERAAEGPFFP